MNMRGAAFALSLAALCGPVSAQEYRQRAVIGFLGHDYIQIDALPHGRAELTYHNHVAQGSVAGTYHVQVGEIIVDVTLTVTQGAESITIMPRDGYMAWPADATAMDGETVTVLIFRELG